MSKEQWWIFTFGSGQPNAGKYVKIYGTFSSARAKMISKYGLVWAFQYPEKQWVSDMLAHPWIPFEQELEVIE